MHEATGDQGFVRKSLAELVRHLRTNQPDVQQAIAATLSTKDFATLEQERLRLLGAFSQVKSCADADEAQCYVHYASRFSLVGLYQSVLSEVFSSIPALQGYGDLNPIWVITPIEEALYKGETFFSQIFELHGRHTSLLQSVLEAWKDLQFERAPYPAGTPAAIAIPDACVIALLADWGGDNPAAKKIASLVADAKPNAAIHLGDIYYGGVRTECDAFLRNWPLQLDPLHPGNGVPVGTSFALNGNHEMYSGGESYFNIVLPALGQSQPFFCLENAHWRIIGLDTAYQGGRLRPTGPDDPLYAQWEWLIALLRQQPKKRNIFLTHHQPVSAHKAEFEASAALREDAAALLATEGVGQDAVFAWFFGHEHRSAIYENEALSFNARLIGSGCIPHEVQKETVADPGCTPTLAFNHGETEPGSHSAASMYAELRFYRQYLIVVYINENKSTWGTEKWDAETGRKGGELFTEGDGLSQLS